MHARWRNRKKKGEEKKTQYFFVISRTAKITNLVHKENYAIRIRRKIRLTLFLLCKFNEYVFLHPATDSVMIIREAKRTIRFLRRHPWFYPVAESENKSVNVGGGGEGEIFIPPPPPFWTHRHIRPRFVYFACGKSQVADHTKYQPTSTNVVFPKILWHSREMRRILWWNPVSHCNIVQEPVGRNFLYAKCYSAFAAKNKYSCDFATFAFISFSSACLHGVKRKKKIYRIEKLNPKPNSYDTGTYNVWCFFLFFSP